MLIILRKGCTIAECNQVEEAVQRLGFIPLPVPGADRTAICVTGNRVAVDPSSFAHLPGVLECIRVTKPYKMVSREVRAESTVVNVGGVAVGGGEPIVVAGPCSVETEARTLHIAEEVKAAGAVMFRAGAFKPRTSPYSFQGLGREGLVTLRRVREQIGLPVVSELVDTDDLDAMCEHVDLIQIGARNMQNYALLKRLAELRRPVLLKRGMSATLEEWLMAAEYMLAGGNENVILCERGIRTFDDHARNTLDLNVVPLVRRVSHLPILVDPSHGVGERTRVRPMARAALAAGAHGLLIETHTEPDQAYSDGQQTIDVATLRGILGDMAVLKGLEPIAPA